jgi:hypothetical protein
MASTYEPIATQTLGSAAASVTFSSIPSTYTDIVLVCNGLIVTNGETPAIQFNTDTGSNYSWTQLLGNGTAASSSRSGTGSSLTLIPSSWTAGWSSTNNNTSIFNIQNYSNTTTYKTVLAKNANATSGIAATVGLWRSTAAIATITVLGTSSSNLASGASFTLYGIKAA